MHKDLRKPLRWLALIWVVILFTCTPLPSGYPARFTRYQRQVYMGLLTWAENRELRPRMKLPLENLAVWDADRDQWRYEQLYKPEAPPEPLRETARSLPEVYPREACAPESTHWCLRVPRLCSEVVEISRDGGTTWEVGWQLPPRRRDFFRRAQRLPPFKRKPRGFCALDVVWVSDTRAFVALGSEGLLEFHPPGTWIRRSMGSAAPTPLRLPGTAALLFVLPEILLAGLIAPWLTFILASRWIGDEQAAATTSSRLQEIISPLKWGLGLGTTALLLLLGVYGARLAFVSHILFLLALLLASIGGVLYFWGGFALLIAVGQMGSAGRWLALQHILLLGLPLVLWLWGMGWWPLTSRETVAVALVGLLLTGWQAFRQSKAEGAPTKPT